eukprot:2876994-Alexandrium_andersonii.AAC.1
MIYLAVFPVVLWRPSARSLEALRRSPELPKALWTSPHPSLPFRTRPHLSTALLGSAMERS